MADPNDTIAALLTADATLVALVGEQMGEQGTLPEDGDVAPALTWLCVSAIGTHDLTAGSGVDRVRVQIDSWGKWPRVASQIAAAVRDVLAPVDAPFAVHDVIGFPAMDPETRTWRVIDEYLFWQERA